MKKGLLLICSMVVWLSGCTNISAPVEEEMVDSTPESIYQEVEILPFTLPIHGNGSLHPAFVDTQINLTLVPLLYEGLYELDENFEARAVLVSEESVSEDGYTWTFTLKDEIYFWDGTLLTGALVASSLNEAKAEGSRFGSRFSGIRSVVGRENQVVVTLSEPNHLLPNLLTIPISYGGGNVPQGTGPYGYWVGSDRLTWNDLWWGEAELPLEVLLVETALEADLISAFDAGQVSLLEGDLTTSTLLGYSGNYQVWSYGSSRMFYLGVEQSWGNTYKTLLGLCSEVIDREALLNQVLLGYGVETWYPVHPDSEMGRALPEVVFEPWVYGERLEQLAAVSYPVRLIVHEGSEQKMSLAYGIADQLGEYGVRVNVEALSWGDYISALERGDFHLYVGEIYLTPDFDLGNLVLSGGEFAYGVAYDWDLEEYWRSYRREGLGILEPDLVEIPVEEAMWLEGYEYLQEELAREPEMDEWGNVIEEVTYPETVWVRGEEVPAHFFTYVREQNTVLPLFFKDQTVLSLWGHIEYMTPVMGNVFYGLVDWVFRG